MDEVFTEYLDLLDQADSAASTFKNNRRSFELLTEFLYEQGLDAKAVRLAHLRQWLKILCDRYAASTVSRHAICVRAAYNHAHELGLIDINPTSGLQKLVPTPVSKLPEVLTGDELRAIHAVIQTERQDLVFHLLTWTGARAGELRPLRWEKADTSYVDFDQDQLVIFGKGSKIRFVSLHPILRGKLEVAAGKATTNCVVSSTHRRELSHETWNQEVKGLMDRAGVEEKSMVSHLWRKSLNTNLVRQKVPEHVLDALFGWAPTTVRTKHYSGVATDEVRSAVLKAYADDPIVPEQGEPMKPETDLQALVVQLQAEVQRLRAVKGIASPV